MRHKLRPYITWALLPLLLFLNIAPANSSISTGGGNTFGATSAADKAIPRFNGTSGKLLQDSSILIDDTNAFEMPVLGSAPANPATGNRKLYWRGTTLYGLSSAGTETAIGGSAFSGLTTGQILVADSSTSAAGSNEFKWDTSAKTLNLSATGPSVHFTDSTTGTTAADGIDIGLETNQSAYFWLYENNYFQIATNNASRFYISGAGNANFNLAADQTDAQVLIKNGTAAQNALRLKGHASQSGHLLDFVNSSDSVLASVDASGGASFASLITGTPITSSYGGTGNGFAKFTGPTTSEKTFTLPNASATILTTNAAVTVAQGGTGQTTLTNHYVLVGAATSGVTAVSPSTSGYVLTSNGVGSDPSFQAPAGGSTLGFLSYYGSPGSGSTNTNIMRWSTADANNAGGSDLSLVQSASAGDYALIGTTGNYMVTGNIQHSSGALHVYIMVTTGALNNAQNGTDSDIRGVAVNPGTYSYPFSAVFRATAGDKVYISCGGSINNTYSKHNRFSIARLN